MPRWRRLASKFDYIDYIEMISRFIHSSGLISDYLIVGFLHISGGLDTVVCTLVFSVSSLSGQVGATFGVCVLVGITL